MSTKNSTWMKNLHRNNGKEDRNRYETRFLSLQKLLFFRKDIHVHIFYDL